MSRPNVEQSLSSLKDFQRETVDYAFGRLWTDPDWTKRFLVADEVGLGKTMVAKGVIAKTVDHLWDIEDRIDIIYICSNTQIARQNLNRLNVVGGNELKHADRLTLLPKVLSNLRGQKVNFVSFTPGTSFNVGDSEGAAEERRVLYWMLAEGWGKETLDKPRWKKFFEGAVQRERFQRSLGDFRRDSLDDALSLTFCEAIESAVGPQGLPLREELEACAEEFNHLRGRPKPDLSRRRNRLIGRLRALVAQSAVEHLEPDLVILDEFQRFKDVLDGDGYGAELARQVFDHPKARVLMLSATPFKMYTLPDEPSGDDHYDDFNRTIEFLAGNDRAATVRKSLRTMRDAATSGGETETALQARTTVEHELTRVMSRMERLASTPDRDGMLDERELPGATLDREDVHSWVTLDEVSRALKRSDVFEYWRSTPYPLNLMERNSYQVRKRFEAAIETQDQELVRILKSARGLLDWDDISRYKAIDPGNAKLRGLFADVLDRGAWKLAWLPPSMPYYEPGIQYADPELRKFTKRLIFSAWTVVPKAIAVMVSYEAERRTIEDAGFVGRTYEEQRATAPPLQYRASGTTVGLLFPSTALARAGDPLAIARASGQSMPMNRDHMIAVVRQRVEQLVEQLKVTPGVGGATDSRWYWAAPALLDRFTAGITNADLVARVRALEELSRGDSPRLGEHLALIARLDQVEQDADVSHELGPMPSDLVTVLTDLAIAGPGVVALRSLSRVCGGDSVLTDSVVRGEAFRVAQGLRSLFNKPEIVALLRSEHDGDAYWREVLHHSIDGCVQAVLDEYVHVLVESQGLQDRKDPHERAQSIAVEMEEALSIRTATNTVEHFKVEHGKVEPLVERAGSHFAARYGRAQSNDNAVMRESTVRMAYNSPFRPFVLASTSVGQEGLDFHTYSHAIVHWNLPSNPVDLEQREGRVHRYKGHAVRKNVAADYGQAALDPRHDDPWAAVFAAAVDARTDTDSEVVPFWVYAGEGGAQIERYVPALPLSKERQHYRRLLNTVVTYRLLLGQPRQEDLVATLGENAEWLRIDLTPGSGRHSA